MKYEAMSDFDINKAVTEVLGFIPEKSSVQRFLHSSSVHITTECRLNGWKLDYCDRWEDAGPVIHAYDIGLEPKFNGGWEAYKVDIWDFDEEGYTKDFWWTDKNPRRAAMIVFLNMQESS